MDFLLSEQEIREQLTGNFRGNDLVFRKVNYSSHELYRLMFNNWGNREQPVFAGIISYNEIDAYKFFLFDAQANLSVPGCAIVSSLRGVPRDIIIDSPTDNTTFPCITQNNWTKNFFIFDYLWMKIYTGAVDLNTILPASSYDFGNQGNSWPYYMHYLAFDNPCPLFNFYGYEIKVNE